MRNAPNNNRDTPACDAKHTEATELNVLFHFQGSFSVFSFDTRVLFYADMLQNVHKD